MSAVDVTRVQEVAVLTLHRGKVNALDGPTVRELGDRLGELAGDGSVRAMVLTGQGKFFSFGLDVPELYPLSRDDFARFLVSFTDLYTALYVFPKPVIVALNGHAVAGGCMLALAGDRRLMAEGPGKISLNEITFGSSVFAGSVEMLRACVGRRRAAEVLLSGTMYEPDQALALGLIDRVTAPAELLPRAMEEARAMGSRSAAAFASMKGLLRGPVVEVMRGREKQSLREFVEIWYSEDTRAQLRGIEIRK